jgi:hypothetical protein
MATKNSDRMPRRMFVFAYPGKPNATINIVVENLKKAQRGRVNAQQSLLHLYKKKAGISKEANLQWSKLTLVTAAAYEAEQR